MSKASSELTSRAFLVFINHLWKQRPMDIRHQHKPLSLSIFFYLIIFKTKIIKEYGLEIRNDEYSEHAISIHRSTEKIKNAFSF